MNGVEGSEGKGWEEVQGSVCSDPGAMFSISGDACRSAWAAAFATLCFRDRFAVKMLQVRFLDVVVGAPGLAAAQVTAEHLSVALGPVAVPGVCGAPGWGGCKTCVSAASEDGLASLWLSQRAHALMPLAEQTHI